MNIKKIVSFVTTSKVKLIAISISALLLIGGALFVNGVINENKSLRENNYRLINNVSQYESLAAVLRKENRVLRLFRDDLRHSNDSMIVRMEKLKKSLKTAKNKPGDVSVGIVTDIEASDTSKIINKTEFKLDTTILYNEYTYSKIKIDKDTLVSKIGVSNEQDLFIYESREYKNKYKNKFIRFLHLDWKKETLYRYNIKNSNDLIEVKRSIVYKINE